jgi:hypothetical protein
MFRVVMSYAGDFEFKTSYGILQWNKQMGVKQQRFFKITKI